MHIEKLPGARVITPILWVVLVGGLAAALWWHFRQPATETTENTTLSVLKSEAMKFLVTRRMTTQIVVQYEQENWLGSWRGVLWAVVHLHYGVDLDKIRPSDIRREGDGYVVRLPGPELLAFGIEPGSIGCLTKSTAAPKIQDLLHNGHRKLLEGRLRTRTLEFAKGHGLMPTRAQIVRELNKAVALFTEAGLRVRFE